MILISLEVMIMSLISEDYKYIPFSDEIFKRMPTADGISSMVQSNYLLGDVSGKNEWTQQPDKASNTFIHLSAYEHFIGRDQLILLGRTGSGKSAIIYSMKNDIQKGSIYEYSDAIQIDEKEFCEKLADLCSGIDINRFDATNKITSSIVMAIYTKVMLYCFETFKEDRIKFRYTIKYLLTNHFIKVKAEKLSDILDKLTSDDYEETIKNLYNSKIVSTVLDVAKLLSKTCDIIKSNNDDYDNIDDFNHAMNEIKSYLGQNKKSVLVLLDSFDEYNINNKSFLIAIKSLILSCFTIYEDSKQNNIYFKIALASEIYTRVLTHLPAKNHTNTVAIIWSYKELIKCMALRFISWYHDENAEHKDKRYLFSFLQNYTVLDIKNSKNGYEIAEEIFNNIIPRICRTNLDYQYVSLAFISRHTMKKPREIIQIFNAIVDRIIHENNSRFFYESSTITIKDVVHSLQNDLIEQTLSIYRIFIPNIGNYIYDLLYDSKFIFYMNDSDFVSKLKQVNAHIQSESSENEYLYYWSDRDIVNVLFETGLLGKVSQVRTIDAANIEQFCYPGQIKIIDALFEYQFKGKIQKSNFTQYVIHPMCYEHYNCHVGTRSMVNTDSFDTTELLASMLSNE